MVKGPAPATGEVIQFFEHPPRSHLYRNADEVFSSMTSGPSDENASLAHSPSSSDRHKKKKALSPLLLTGLMYTFTIGGAYGIEESVMGGGALLTVISTVAIPIFMAIPTAVIVAEMASAIPSNAGFLMWINLACHRAVYLAMVILSLLLIFVDNALYPVLFSEYFCTAISCPQRWHSALLRLAIIMVTFVLNILGVEAVGVASVVLTIITVSPFLLIYLIQQFKSGFYLNWPALSFIPSKVEWTTFITTASWNLSGLEQAGAVAEDIPNPQSTILQALIPLIGLAFMTYTPPVLAGASTDHSPIDLSEWTTGFWSEVSARIGGLPLKYITVVGSVLSAFGLTLSALCTTTGLIAGMALTEAFPGVIGEWLSHRNERFGTYHWAIVLNTVVTALFSTLLDFGPLVKMDQFLYGIRVLMIFFAFFRCRTLYPHLKRPFRVPLSGWKLYAVFTLPFLSFVGLTVVSLLADVETPILCLSVLAGVALLSWAYCFFYRKTNFLGRVVTIEVTSS